MLFISKTSNDTFHIIQTLDNNTGIRISPDQKLPIKESYCQQILFGNQGPLIINDSHTHPFTSKLPITDELNIHSYIGVPIFYKNGEMFGTLCALDSKPSNYEDEDIEILEKFSNLFSYVIELEQQMKIDFLTGLYNRNYLYNHFHHLAEEGSMMLIDLDGFKQVNDHYGHDVGDQVLMEVGHRLKQNIHTEDLAIRLGGDEFVLVFPNKTDMFFIEEIGSRISKQLSNWTSFFQPISVSASIGIVQFTRDGNNLRELLKKADTAMYNAKRAGKNTYIHF